jgi:Fur family transcriptional regulator, ferric uptake regulator
VELPAVEVSQSPEDKFREYLASRPRTQRYTGQQREMVRFVFSRHSHFDADTLFKEMDNAGLGVSRATVYRTLSKLVDAGLLRQIDMGSRIVYEHDYGYPQHDHLHCQKCNKYIEFQHPSVAAVIQEVCGKENFRSEGHTFVVRGICGDCNRARVVKRRLDLV